MIRLYVTTELSPGTAVAPTLDQSRYLTQVMRLKLADDLLVFNGRDGEWRCSIAEVLKKGVLLRAEEQVRPQTTVPDVHLLIAVVKKSALEFAVEKATELGSARIGLVQTDRTQVQHVRLDRLDAIAMESAEQTGRMDVPVIDATRRLTEVLDGWDATRKLMFCNETGGQPAIAAVQAAGAGPWTILIGPEGGFSPDERERLRALPFTTAVSLGPRVLRADTAATTALTLWQAAVGDWAR
ncbi:Ribosomal RNA small subunit methyltransferase E [Brevundimonas sp. NIBR10]|uniref:16S rRNA (uracil(1498)-N(3))-methyltransferase n=1 Tax=Brevundimonas sp. NIBR10 TaxID=3015997 RepID=UPI0022F15217|nr:16S rRNA (uracil(1498)-N(3))-methyltransferase [Brevundimonas sp. NIBR10]WGM45281.1 Ribosomal RNA small subunit methyltransferase E [Brevundimonas sp. NIBR10]